MDAVHGRAGAYYRIKTENCLFRMLLRQPMYEVDLGSYSPDASCGSLLDLLDDILGRAIQVCRLHDLTAAFGMYQDFHAWIFCPRFLDLLHVEAHMCRAITFPENDARPFDLLVSTIGSHRIARIPYVHLSFRNAVFQ